MRGLRRVVLTTTGVLLLAAPAALACAGPPAPNARPTGGQVVAGTASIAQTTAQTTINQSTQRAAINFQSSTVGSQHTFQFNQPNASAVTLVRVTGPDPSSLVGKIAANGSVIITTPSGVTVCAGAQLNATSVFLSSAGVTNRNFIAGKMVFDQLGKPGARVTNAGTITVRRNGLAGFLAPGVGNTGLINARLGRLALAAGEAATVDLYGDGLVSVDVTRAVHQVPLGAGGKAVPSLLTNTGSLIANGGRIQLVAKAVDGIVQNLMAIGGRTQANPVANGQGQIGIGGVGGSVSISGKLIAQGGPGLSGGSIQAIATNAVSLGTKASISASGYAQGGVVALGTTIARAKARRAGQNPGIPQGTSRRVVVPTGAAVSANGLGTGAGGTIAILSTQLTRVAGTVSARGGPSGGNGGLIELSSAGTLNIAGSSPDVSAPSGSGGTVLYDPRWLIR